jgi:hypothetical protein
MHAGDFGLEDTAVIFNPSNLFFAAPLENHHLMETIDTHLDRLKKDPQSLYYKSMKQWTSEKVQFSLPAYIT